MNIGVRYKRDFKRTYWCTLYLRRKAALVLASTGVLVLLVAFLPPRSSQAATVILAVIGIVLLVEVPVVIWLMVSRNWDALNEEVEVTVTSEEVVQRTATTSLRLSWDMMQRIISLKDMWLFYAGRLKVVTLYKGALTAAQQAELAAFIEARKRLAGTRTSCHRTTAMPLLKALYVPAERRVLRLLNLCELYQMGVTLLRKLQAELTVAASGTGVPWCANSSCSGCVAGGLKCMAVRCVKAYATLPAGQGPNGGCRTMA
jgi:hypothetical protein